jgi:hypothetical protein
MMKRIYYTQEGSPYCVKIATKNSTILSPGGTFQLRVCLNSKGTLFGGLQTAISIDTNKRIVPIQMFASFTDDQSTPYVDIASVAYACYKNAGLDRSFDHQPSLMKIFPFADLIYSSSDEFYQYKVDYNQPVLSDNDFLKSSEDYRLYYQRNLSNALTSNGATAAIPNGGLSTLTFYISVGFIYFEML